KRSQKLNQKRRTDNDPVGDSSIGPVFRDYLLGPLMPLDRDGSSPPSFWRDESSGEVVDSREHLISFVLDWAMEYCVDDEGLISLLHFRNLRTHGFYRKVEIREGVDVGRKRSITFGAAFSDDSPLPSENPGEGRPRNPFQSPTP
ncbi:MAG: hypothetical protein M3151_07610, partial [Actinomycetota bacterium]|nr:hypothetical protein [Actinomycetota bacterium]